MVAADIYLFFVAGICVEITLDVSTALSELERWFGHMRRIKIVTASNNAYFQVLNS